jgi:hypothetical protein
MMTSNEQLSQFEQFAQLPPELQDHVWDLATPVIVPGIYAVDIMTDASKGNQTVYRRRSTLHGPMWTPRAAAIQSCRALSQVCRRSRAAFERFTAIREPLELAQERASFTSTSMPSSALPTVTIDAAQDMLLLDMTGIGLPLRKPSNRTLAPTVRHIGIIFHAALPLRMIDRTKSDLKCILEHAGPSLETFDIIAHPLYMATPWTVESIPPDPIFATSALEDLDMFYEAIDPTRRFKAGRRTYYEIEPRYLASLVFRKLFASVFLLVQQYAEASRTEAGGTTTRGIRSRILTWTEDVSEDET